MLLLRLVAGVPVVADGIKALLSRPGLPTPWMHILELAGGTLLFLGLWTPIGGALQALAQGWCALRHGALDISPLIAAAIGVSLIMLGPGAWSVDARLYGRKRIPIIPGK